MLIVADVTLAQKLTEELSYEKEASGPAEPEFLKGFKAQGIWQVCDLRFSRLSSSHVSHRLRMLPATTR